MVERVPPEIAQALDERCFDISHWSDDELAARDAVSNNCLPHDRLSELEQKYFYDVCVDKHLCQMYLLMRNKMLVCWQLEPNVELTIEHFSRVSASAFRNFPRLLRRVHGFLTRYGYINYGCFYQVSNPSKQKTVIVIGAGASGLAAARQLKFFGFDVVVLEGRDRVGGRAQTFKLRKKGCEAHGMAVDLGASIITGFRGNPLITMLRQINCMPFKMNSDCILYDEQGKQVERLRSVLIHDTFKDVGRAVNFLAHVENVTTVAKFRKTEDGRLVEEEAPMHLEKGYELILDQLDLNAMKTKKEYWIEYRDILHRMHAAQFEIKNYTSAIRTLAERSERLKEAENEAETRTQKMVAELKLRFQQYDFSEAFKRLDEVKARFKKCEQELMKYKKKVPPDVFMHAQDKKILNFHLATKELEMGTTLDNLDVKNWDQKEIPLKDTKIAFHDGFGCFVEKMADFNANPISNVIKFKHIVTDVIYDEQEVTVKYYKDDNSTVIEELKAACVVCTVPLGVLKKEKIRFDPPLPKEKQDVIRNMGFGNINKVVLFFKKNFWNMENIFIGNLNKNKELRGENFLFMVTEKPKLPGAGTSIEKVPILTAFLSGNAAEMNEPDVVIVDKTMNVLERIFGSNNVNRHLLLEAVVTRWHQDPFSHGCFCHIPPGFSNEIFDEMAKTVGARAEDGSYSGSPRVFFAGEHTFRKASGTVQGAWMSGIEAAAKIANEFLGTPFAAENVHDVELVDLSDDEVMEIDAEDNLSSVGDIYSDPIPGLAPVAQNPDPSSNRPGPSGSLPHLLPDAQSAGPSWRVAPAARGPAMHNVIANPENDEIVIDSDSDVEIIF